MVSEQIEEGRGLLIRLGEAGFEVTVACWALRAEDDRWVFFIAKKYVLEVVLLDRIEI